MRSSYPRLIADTSALGRGLHATALAILTLLFAAGSTLALDHSGTIGSNETWLAADNPHNVVGHVTVSAGITLTLEPDVEVYLNGSLRLDIYGVLAAVGAPGQEILFTRSTGTNWNYIRFLSSGSGTFDHCTIEYSNNGFYTGGTGTISVSNSILQNNSYGIYLVSTSAMSVTDCQFLDNSYGVYATGGTFDLGSTTFTGNTTYGYYGQTVSPNLLDANVVFTDNATSLRVADVAGLNLTTTMNVTGSTSVGIHLEDCDGPTIDNQVLTGNSGGQGALFLDDCGEFTLGAGNTIGGMGLENSWPVTIGAGSFPSTLGVIPATGNTNNDIQVNGGSSTQIGTWPKFADLNYIVTGNPTVLAGGELILEAGVEVYLDASRRIDIYGTMTAVGTSGQEILFTQNTASAWNYIRFLSGGGGTFDYCIIEYSNNGIYGGGSGTIAVSNSTMQNNSYSIYSVSASDMSVTDCQFLDNSYGAYATGGTFDLGSTAFTGNTTYGYYGQTVSPNLLDANVVFTDNATSFRVDDVAGLNLTTGMNVTGSTAVGIHLEDCDGPTIDNQVLTGSTGANGAFFLDDCGEFTLGAGNTIGGMGLENSWPVTIGAGSFPAAAGVIPTTGNTNNDIQVVGGSSPRVGTWRKFTDLDYIVTGNPGIEAGGELIIEPAVNLRFDASRRLDVYGTLTAVGAAGQEILFTQNTASAWNYIRFLSGGGGTFDYCTIEYSNNGIYGGGSGTIAVSNSTLQNNSYSIYSLSTADMSVTDCQFLDNSYGAYATGGTFDLGSTAFTGNTTYGYYGQTVSPNLLDANVVFTDNATSFRVDDVAGLNLTTGMNVTGSTAVGIHLEDCDGPTIDNQVLTGSTGANGAFFLDDCGEFTLGAGNTIGGMGLENSWPVTITVGSFPAAAGVIPTTGNTNNDIQVTSGGSPRVGTWRKFTDLDYIVTGNPTVEAGGELILEPAVNLRFDASRRLDIFGTLTAVGALGQEILFTQNTGSLWNYLRFLSGGGGTFDYCTIEHSNNGIYGNGSGTVDVSNATLQNNGYGIYSLSTAAMSVTDCQFLDNSYGAYATGGTFDLGSTIFIGQTTYGFYGQSMAPNLLDEAVVFTDNATSFRVDNVAGLNLTTGLNVTGSTTVGIHLEDCDGPTIDNQVLTGSTGSNGALFLDDCGEFTLGAGNTIGGMGLENSWPVTITTGSFPAAAGVIPTTGNTNNDIQVVGGSSSRTGTWRKFADLDYIITGNPGIEAGGELIIEPAVNLRFDASRRLDVYGTLTAVGAAGQEILFTQNTASAWNYIRFLSDGGGTIDYCNLENSSNGIYATGSGTIDVSNATLQNNSYGIHSISTASMTISGCQLVDNTYGFYATGAGDISVTDCLVENNGHGVRANDGTISFLTTRIINNTDYGVYLGGAVPTFGNSLTEWNDIYGNGSGEQGRDLRNHEFDIDARYVHWGTMDYAQILTQVWDYHDDFDLGYVQVLPFINATHDGQFTAVDDFRPEGNIPLAFGLYQNAPNPFNPSTVIRFELAGAETVNLKVFDVTGALVATLLDDSLPSGPHQAVWHGRDDQGRAVPSGVYFYRLTAGENIETRQMMLLK